MDPIILIGSRSPFELQIRLLNLVQGKLNCLPFTNLQVDQTVGARGQGTLPAARIFTPAPARLL